MEADVGLKLTEGPPLIRVAEWQQLSISYVLHSIASEPDVKWKHIFDIETHFSSATGHHL